MTIVQWLSKLASYRPASCVGFLVATWAAFAPIQGSAQPAPPPALPPLCAIPATPPVLPADDCLWTNQRDMISFGTMAWQAFRFVTYPTEMMPGLLARPVRGQVAPNGTSLAGPPVFLTFKADWETFRANAAPPLAWQSFPPTAEPCVGQPGVWPGTLVLASTHEFGNVTEPTFQGLTNVLPAQNGQLVRYMTSFGRQEFHLIKQDKLYDSNRSNIKPASNSGSSGDAQKMIQAIVVKSAWVEMTPDLHQPHPFYTRFALVQDIFTGVCHQAVVGLVGLHIVQKTFTSPQWIWSSFEHVDNVPGPLGGHSTFNNGDGSLPSSPPADTVSPPWTAGTPAPAFHPTPFNVQLKQSIAPEIDALNTIWQARMGGVWANYKLVTVQWPGLGHLKGMDAMSTHPTPPLLSDNGTNMANTAMETFLQDGGHPAHVDHTCMGCHNNTRNYDFVWSVPINDKEGYRFGDDRSVRVKALKLLQEIVGQEKRQDRR